MGALRRELSFPLYTEPASVSRGVVCGDSARNRGLSEPGRKESQQFQNVVRDIFGLEASELASLGAKRFHGKPPLIGLSPSTQRRGKSANLCYHSISFRPGSETI
jgi:hypothetical protein